MEKPRIVLINPPLSQEERYGVKFKAGGQTPPNGLCMIAAVTMKNGYPTEIIDGAALEMNYECVVRQVLEKNPKYVGITAVTISIFNAIEIAKRIKSKNKDIKIILGGPHITAAPYETFERFGDFIDIGVIGEGEVTIIDLLNSLEKKKNLRDVKGIAYLKRGKTIITKPREFIADLDTLPFPAWDLLPNLAKYYCPPAHTLKRMPAALLVTSRGCPGQCTFCDNKVFGRRYRWHSPEYIIKLIKMLKAKYGIKEIQFKDDNLLVNKENLKKLCGLMIREELGVTWGCSGRIDMVNPEILKIMKNAGCWQIWYGMESGSNKVLKAIKKNITVNQIKEAVKWTKEAGISPGGFFMLGLPTEIEEDIKKTIKLMLELPLDEFHISHLTPFPGSELYNTAHNYGHFDNNWKKMSGWNIIFVPRGLKRKDLIYYSNLAFRKFYFRPRIILNYARKINSLSQLKFYFGGFLALLNFVTQEKR